MSPAVLGILLAVTGASPQLPADALAFNRADALAFNRALPQQQVLDATAQALPPAPTLVVRKTRYYGTVTFDHRGHLARRAPCASCHGVGQVTKIEFTPKEAHDRCIGCHREEQAGPTACKDCHVKDTPAAVLAIPGAGQPAATPSTPVAGAAVPPSTPVAGAAVPPATAVAGAAVPPSTPALVPSHGPAAATQATPSELAQLAIDTDGGRGRQFTRSMELGVTAGPGLGPSFRVVAREHGLTFTQSVERVNGTDDARTLGLLGAGISRVLVPQLRAEVLAVGGFDAMLRPSVRFTPALGARAGIAWLPRRWRIDAVQLSVTAVADLLDGEGGSPGDVTFLTTLGTEFAFTGR